MNHKWGEKRGVSPVIAVLLLIAIAVATGILVYVWVSNLAGSLTTGGGTQAAEQLQLEAYDFVTDKPTTLYLYLRNPGGINIEIDKIYVFQSGTGTIYTATFNPSSVSPGASTKISVTLPSGLNVESGYSYTVKIVTKTGAVFVFTVIAGRSS